MKFHENCPPRNEELVAPLSGTHKKLQYGNNFTIWKFLDLVFYLNYFSFSHPNLTHLPKNESLSPKHLFSQLIWYVECYSVHAHMVWSQKFRSTPAPPKMTGCGAPEPCLKHTDLYWATVCTNFINMKSLVLTWFQSFCSIVTSCLS